VGHRDRRARKPSVIRRRVRRERPEDDDEAVDPNLIGFEDRDGCAVKA